MILQDMQKRGKPAIHDTTLYISKWTVCSVFKHWKKPLALLNSKITVIEHKYLIRILRLELKENMGIKYHFK